MAKSDFIEIHAYKCGRHYQYYGVKHDGSKVMVKMATKRFYPMAYEFDRDVHTCKTAAGKRFLLRGKSQTFTHPPIKLHIVLNKGPITND